MRVAEDIPHCIRLRRKVWIIRIEGHAFLKFRQRCSLCHTSSMHRENEEHDADTSGCLKHCGQASRKNTYHPYLRNCKVQNRFATGFHYDTEDYIKYHICAHFLSCITLIIRVLKVGYKFTEKSLVISNYQTFLI